MATTTDRLLALAAMYEQKAQGLRMAAAELNGHQVEKKQQGFEQTLNGAIALRRPRGSRVWTPEQRAEASRQKKPLHAAKLKRAAKKRWPTNAEKLLQRQATAALLEKFDSTPRTLADVGVTNGRLLLPSLRWGYLKHKGGKGKQKRYVRTSVPFDPSTTRA